jgi:hypothetical protein
MQKRISTVLCLVVSMGLSQFAHAWGHLGHQTVAEIGSTLTTNGNKFWTANTSNLGVLANVPDVVWKSLPTAAQEKPTHFFQPDSYISDPNQFGTFPRIWEDAVAKYTQAALNITGTATWRAKQLYELAVKAFRQGDFVTGLQYAGTMSHYIGDLSQPLHDAKNYDGQETGDVGIHSYFETKNVQAAGPSVIDPAITTAATALLVNKVFVKQSSGVILDTVFNEVTRAYAHKDELISIDLKQGRSGAGAQALLKLAIDRMADGAATLSLIYSRMWVDAGSPANSQQLSVDATPTWIAPNYAAGKANFISQAMTLAIADDCD